MLSLSKFRPRQDLLGSYSEMYADAMRRSKSLVALRAAKVESELAMKARGAFLASMNHELRTPLNAITGFAGLLMDTSNEELGNERRNEYLGYILQSAELLLSHIDTIIAIADAESGGTALARRAFDLRDVLRQATEEMAADNRVKIDAPRAVPLVDADPDKIASALNYLLVFATRNNTLENQVTISVRSGLAGKSAGYVYVSLEQPEIYQSAEELEASYRFFETFEDDVGRRFDAERMALPISKCFIELNGGKFNLKSSKEGGTLVRFALPIASADHQRQAEQLVS